MTTEQQLNEAVLPILKQNGSVGFPQSNQRVSAFDSESNTMLTALLQLHHHWQQVNQEGKANALGVELNLSMDDLLLRWFSERVCQEVLQPELLQTGSGKTSPVVKDSAAQASQVRNRFLEKLYAVIEEKLDDTSFSIEDLAERLAMSRSFLHRKVKALTGLAASDLMRVHRLKRATQLLRQGFNSSETAYQVGFDSPQYFAKYFRDQYQMTPTEFARQG